MNERIRELALQADKWSQTMTWSSDPKYGDRPVSDLFNEKFAQLIIRECAEFLCNMPDHGMHNYYKHASLKVKEHFGVEC